MDIDATTFITQHLLLAQEYPGMPLHGILVFNHTECRDWMTRRLAHAADKAGVALQECTLSDGAGWGELYTLGQQKHAARPKLVFIDLAEHAARAAQLGQFVAAAPAGLTLAIASELDLDELDPELTKYCVCLDGAVQQ